MRLYKIEITERPLVSLYERQWHDGTEIGYIRLSDDEMHAKWVEAFGDDESFYLPSETKLYRSRSSAQDKVRITERWGGKAVILEAEVSEFIPVAEANARRKIQAMNERANRLQSKVDLIRTQSEVVAIKAGINGLPF